MSTRAKVVIIGADSTAFHIFNTIYRSDERYEILYFINPDINSPQQENILYPPNLSGTLYPNGLPILKTLRFQKKLTEDKVEKCIFSHFCVTSGTYLNLAAQCLSAGCQVVSPNIDSTKLTPPKPLISYFSDTQFDYEILNRILSVYQSIDLKPLVAFSGNVTGLRGDKFVIYNNCNSFERSKMILGEHQYSMCHSLLCNDYQIAFIYDFDAFSAEIANDEKCKSIVMVGFNSLPCFFKSHLQIYSCDDFTFGEDVSQHSSAITAEQSDVVIYCSIGKSDDIKLFNYLKKDIKRQVIDVTNGFCSLPKENSKTLLVDDPYPTILCTAVNSISQKFAEDYKLDIVSPPGLNDVTPETIFYEPTEKRWPALILPDSTRQEDIDKFKETIESCDCEIVLSSAQRSLPTISDRKVIKISFQLNTSVIDEDLLELPARAFIKQHLY